MQQANRYSRGSRQSGNMSNEIRISAFLGRCLITRRTDVANERFASFRGPVGKQAVGECALTAVCQGTTLNARGDGDTMGER